mgnify:CR=1 FL=1
MYKKKPFFVTFEGIEGSGKSYQSLKLYKNLKKRNISTLLTREPGGTKGAEKIREVILKDYFHKNSKEQFAKYTDTLLYLAARNEHIIHKIKPSIIKKEKINISLDDIIAISTNANGDLRYAINTLQTYDSTLDQIPSFISKSLSLDQGIRQYLDSEDISSAMNSLLTTNSNPNDILRAIFSSVVSSSSKIPNDELSRILSILSDVDILLGKILKTREWRQLRYFNSLLVYSLFEHLSPHPIKFSLYHNPFPIQVRIWNDGRNFRTIVKSLNKYSNEPFNHPSIHSVICPMQ